MNNLIIFYRMQECQIFFYLKTSLQCIYAITNYENTRDKLDITLILKINRLA